MSNRECTKQQIEEDFSESEKIREKIKDLLVDHFHDDYQRQFARHTLAMVMLLGDMISQEAVQSETNCDCGNVFGHMLGRLEHISEVLQDRALWQFGQWLAKQDWASRPDLREAAAYIVAKRSARIIKDD